MRSRSADRPLGRKKRALLLASVRLGIEAQTNKEESNIDLTIKNKLEWEFSNSHDLYRDFSPEEKAEILKKGIEGIDAGEILFRMK